MNEKPKTVTTETRPMIATCTRCLVLFEASSEENTCTPGVLCPSCYRTAVLAVDLTAAADPVFAGALAAADAPEVAPGLPAACPHSNDDYLDTDPEDLCERRCCRDCGAVYFVAPASPGAPLNLRVAGRGKLTATASVFHGVTTLRLDCDRDSAFWAEVVLTEADLVELLARVRAAT